MFFLELGLQTNNPLFHDDASTSDDPKVRDFAAKIAAAEMLVLGTTKADYTETAGGFTLNSQEIIERCQEIVNEFMEM
jgi:hypothetical protein